MQSQSAHADLASGQADIHASAAGAYRTEVKTGIGVHLVDIRSEDITRAHLDELRSLVSGETELTPVQKETALRVLDMAEDPAHVEAREAVARALKEGKVRGGLSDRLPGPSVALGLAILTLGSWYASYRANHITEARINNATVN